MKHLVFLLMSLLVFGAEAQSFFEKAESFFAKHVKDGAVAYESIKENPSELNDLVKEIADLDLSNKRVSPDFIKAFYINAYNLLVIKEVIDLYPIYGPLKVDGFFNGIKHTVMGQEMTLDELEKGTLYKEFPDARLHFVLVCAAKGCPPIAAFGYFPDELDKQLTERTKTVLNLEWFVRVKGKKVEISQLFDWYAKDFGEPKAYINKYRTEKITDSAKISYYQYDWSLNNQ
ncbi:MAG: DUF547 domain-containing protein [Cyclobacteriaceae bacterium]